MSKKDGNGVFYCGAARWYGCSSFRKDKECDRVRTVLPVLGETKQRVFCRKAGDCVAQGMSWVSWLRK